MARRQWQARRRSMKDGITVAPPELTTNQLRAQLNRLRGLIMKKMQPETRRTLDAAIEEIEERLRTGK